MSSTSSISALIDGLINEAAQAPRLFSDLAKIERYIAESYKTRALIELLQNADDAGATEFIAQSVDDGLVVANNGRAFTIADVEALCRSGASNKQRGGATIGYRGVGFKSVVNLAERVCVFSGEQRFIFDRDRTRSVLGFEQDVPLIRIPHLVEAGDANEKLIGGWRGHYTTVFFFASLNSRLLLDDVGALESGCLLFLNQIERVTLRIAGVDRDFIRSSHAANNRRFILLADTFVPSAWEILSGEGDRIARVALKMDEDRIVPVPFDQATIHSFTPTTEYAGAPVKLNGDFTTDPSRKTVDLDSTSSDESAFYLGAFVLLLLSRKVTQQLGDSRYVVLFGWHRISLSADWESLARTVPAMW